LAKRILLIDDDDLLRRSLAFNLDRAGFRTVTAASGEDALVIAQAEAPDLVLLDIGLPGMDGLDVLRQLRQQINAPVVFLTARRRDLDEVLGLELGADDYVTKPFDIDVLLARVRAVLRRSAPSGSPDPHDTRPIVVGDLVIDPARHSASVGDQPLELTPREFDLLLALAREAGRVVSVDTLLARVWGAEYQGEPQAVYVHIRWLREKIEQDPRSPKRILTVRGVGYKLLPA